MLRTASGLWVTALLALAAPALGADILFVSDSNTDVINIPAVLTGDGHNVTVVSNDFAAGNAALLGPLSSYGAVYWSATGPGYGDYHANPALFANLEAYVSAGGRVFVTGYDTISSPTDANLLAFIGGVGNYDGGNPAGPVIDVVNSLTTGVVDIRGVVPTGAYGDQDTVVGVLPGTIGVVPSYSTGEWAWTLRTLGSGEIAYVSNGAYSNGGSPPGEWSNWLDTTPPPSGAGAYNAALRNFAAAAGGILLPPPPEAVHGCVRLRSVRMPTSRFAPLVVRADVDFHDWSLDLREPATIEYGTQVVDIPDGFKPNRRRTSWQFRQGRLYVTIRTPRNDSSKGELTLVDWRYEDARAPADEGGEGEPFHFGFSCAVQDVAADVWLDVDRAYDMGRTPAVMEPLTVRQFRAQMHRGAARRLSVEAEFAGTNDVPVTPPTVILRVGEPGHAFQIRLPNDDYIALPAPGGWVYRIDPASGRHPRRGLWLVQVDYTDRSVTAQGSDVVIGTFPAARTAPVYVSLAVDGVESAVEIFADVVGRKRLVY